MSSCFVPARRSKASGFTLIEIMVTLVIFALVATTITLVLMTSAKSKQHTSQHLESEQSARAALDLIARDVRTAGYGDDLDYASPQPAIAYVDAGEIILSENLAPYPDGSGGPSAPLAYNPTANPKPYPLDGTAYAPPIRYRTGAELVRYTLDVNNDGVVDASDLASAQGADAAATPNPTDYVLVRQVYGDSTANVANNNGGTTERVALIRKPGDSGVPPLFKVYMRGSSTPWDWNNGPVPPTQLQNIQRVDLQVTAASSRPDSKGLYAQTTLKSQVNATRSVPDFGIPTYSVSGYVYKDANLNRVKDSGDVGLSGATVRMGSFVAYSNGSGLYSFHAPAGSYTLKHTPPMGYGSYSSPDTTNLTVTTTALTWSFADTARAGGIVAIRAFNDKDGDAKWGLSEDALQGIRFTITPGTPGATTAVTDALGSTTLFTPPGGYAVTCNNPDSMAVTTSSTQSGSMSNGGSASMTFGLNQQFTGHVSGKVFVDANRNGSLDGSEAGVANVWVAVSKDKGLSVAGYAYTDASGNYNITVPVNDPPHTTPYAVYMVPPPGYFPTSSSSIGSVYVQQNQTLSNKNFGMANFQIITLAASRVLSLIATDLIENDWNGNHIENARADQDLILGADAGGTDNVSVWFNRYASSPLFSTTASNPDGYTRLAPNSVMCMVADTLDKDDVNARPDIVTGTKYTTSGNFFVWFTQGSSNNEGYLPTAYSANHNYKTQDNGDVQAVVTLDCGGGAQPDILVGTKSPTAGQGSLEVWLSNDATTPTFTRDETISSVSGSPMGEVTGMALADLDNDGDRDLVVVTRTSDYNGQLVAYENRGRTSDTRWTQRYVHNFSGDAPTSIACLDAGEDGYKDIFVGTQRSLSQGRIYQFNNLGGSPPLSFSNVRTVDARGIVMSLNAGEFGGNAGRMDLAVGHRSSTVGYGGGVTIYYMDLGLLPSTSVDPSAGSVINMVPALASANFNYGLNTTTPPSPYLTDLAAGVKASAGTGALVVFIR